MRRQKLLWLIITTIIVMTVIGATPSTIQNEARRTSSKIQKEIADGAPYYIWYENLEEAGDWSQFEYIRSTYGDIYLGILWKDFTIEEYYYDQGVYSFYQDGVEEHMGDEAIQESIEIASSSAFIQLESSHSVFDRSISSEFSEYKENGFDGYLCTGVYKDNSFYELYYSKDGKIFELYDNFDYLWIELINIDELPSPGDSFTIEENNPLIQDITIEL